MNDNTSPSKASDSASPINSVPSEEEESGRIFDWVKSLLSPKLPSSQEDHLREAIEELIEEGNDASSSSSVAAHERMLIANILQLRDMPVVDIMIPRADIIAIDVNITREALYQLLAEKPHSRLPVYKGDLDNILGTVYMKDLVARMAAELPFDIKGILRDILVVSPAMRTMDLLLQMRQSKVHIAFVVDEFGGIDGLITINDLIETIVGEIDDEYNFDIAPQLIERSDGSVIVDARYPLTTFEDRFGELFDENEEHQEVDTLGGLVAYLAGHVPTRGEIVRHEKSGLEFDILEADPRRVLRLRIRNLPQKDKN